MSTGDNLPIMRGMDTESVDLIYLDPPFNSKKHWAAPTGSKASGAAFKHVDTRRYRVTDLGVLAEERPKLPNLINAIGDINGKKDNPKPNNDHPTFHLNLTPINTVPRIAVTL